MTHWAFSTSSEEGTYQDAMDSGLHRANVNVPDDMGMTPLHWAALKKDAKTVGTLFAAGANVNTRNKRGRSALWKACLINSEACAKTLLAFGADVNAGCNYGYRPIHAAAQCNATETLLSLLVANGADVDELQNAFARSPLARCVAFNGLRSCKHLLRLGANIDRADREGNPPLFEAVMKNSHDCLEFLLASGTNHRHVRPDGQNLLHVAAMRDDARTFDILGAFNLTDLSPEGVDAKSMTARQYFAARSSLPQEPVTSFDRLLQQVVAKANNEHHDDFVDEDTTKDQFVDAPEYL
jgi:ankyrin repeat protein